MPNPTKLVVVGQGYVGLPLAIRAVEVGFDVVGYDLDKIKIDGLASGRSHTEDVSDQRIASALASGRYRPTSDEHNVDGFDIGVITVPTPLRDGAPDISYIEAAARTLGSSLTAGSLVVLESTTYPGTTEEIVAPLLEAESGLTAGLDFRLGFSPERIDPGNQQWTFERTPKLVSGIDAESLAAVDEFYQKLVDKTVPVSGTSEAELAKLLENTFRHINIALINELATHANRLGIDIWEVVEAASTKPFGFMPFYPGPGVGGHCLPVDPYYLSWRFERRLGTVSRFVKVAGAINEAMPAYVVSRVQNGLNIRKKPLNGSTVLVLGLAYKKNSGDARETPTVGIVQGLIGQGVNVRIHDEHVGYHELDEQAPRVPLTVEEIRSADAVILVTDHDDVDYGLVTDNALYIFDTRHRLVGSEVESL